METNPYKCNLDKLKAGAMLRSVNKENNEPENIAIGQVSKELRYLQRHSQYISEIERVLNELRLTTFLIKDCKTCTLPSGINRQNLLVYYQGIFLNLVHQIKDKIMQLINLMTEDKIPEKPTEENDVSVSDLQRKKIKQLQEIGIEEEINQWNQANMESNIAVVLRKRTYHHHRVSGLIYNDDFLNLAFTDIAAQPSFQEILTDYGKQEIEKMRLESTERLFSDALTKAESTLKEIESNIENISNSLTEYFKLPISQEEARKAMEEQSAMLESFKVINRCSVANVPEPYRKLLEEWTKAVCERFKGQILSIYLIGSLGRGEYEEGYSDVNIYIILDIDVPIEISRDSDFFKLNLRVFTKAQFYLEQSKKYRIIAKADGLLLYGKDIIKNEKIPKAGLFLALILNDDIVEILDNAKKWMEENPTASAMEISLKSKWLAKRLIDFMYTVVMSNKPQYTANRRERASKIMEMYPEDKKVIETLMDISKYGLGEFESFKNTIEGFKPRAEMNLKKMQEVKRQLSA